MEIKELCEESHKNAIQKGFCKDPRPIPELLMLIVTELGEACEADRKGDTDGFKQEIADCFIRLGDLCEEYGINIEVEIIKKMEYNKGRPKKHGKLY